MTTVRSSAVGMDEYFHIACDPCRYTGKTVTATKYCEDCGGHLCPMCSSSHMIGPKTRDHRVTYIISRRTGTGNSGADDSKAVLSNAGKKCKTHRKSAVSFCVIHQDVCCRTCIESSHKTCKLQVLSGDAETSHVFRRGTGEIRRLETDIKRLQERFETIRREKQANLQALTQQNDNYTTAVKAYRRNLNSLLDKLQQTLLRKKERHYENKADELKTCMSTCQSSISVLGDALNKLDLANRNTDLQQVSVATKKMDAVLRRCEASFEQVEKLPRHYGFHFQAEVSLEKYLKGVAELGKIKEDYVEANVRNSPRKHIPVEGPKAVRTPQKAALKISPPYNTRQGDKYCLQYLNKAVDTKHAWCLDDKKSDEPVMEEIEKAPKNIRIDDDVIDNDVIIDKRVADNVAKHDKGGSHTDIVIVKPQKVVVTEHKEIYSYVASPRKVKLKMKPKQTCDELIVRLPTDKKMCSITGSAFMPDDKIVLADSSNKSIKMFTADLKQFAQLDTASAPRDVAAVSMAEVVCTIPNDKTIQLLSVVKEMFVKRTYRLDIECYGIEYFQQKLYVSSGWSTEREVQVIDLSGKLLKKIEFKDDIFKCPLYVTVQPTTRHIYVSDYENGVICFDEAGSLISRCHNMDTKGYMGICSGCDGDVFVSTLQPNGISKVIVYPSSTRPYTAELDMFIALPNKGGQRPRSIAFSKKTPNKMMLTFVGQNVDVVDIYTM